MTLRERYIVSIKKVYEHAQDVIIKFKKILDINIFLSNVLIPLIVLGIYCKSFAYWSFRFLPISVNYFFTTRLFNFVLILTAGLSLICFVNNKSRENKNFLLNHSIDKFTSSNILIILVPLTPIVQYVLINQDILSAIVSLQILVAFLLIIVLYIIAVPLLFSFAGSTKILIINGLAFVFTIFSMALLSQHYAWFETGNFGIQLSFFSLVFSLFWLLFNLKDKRVLNILIMLFFVSNTTTQLLTKNVGSKDSSSQMTDNRLSTLVSERIPIVRPNIYLLVYDAYIANETMSGYGIDNSSQEGYLIDQGFQIYPHTYTIGSPTIESMSRVLNASTNFYGNPRRAVSGDGIVQNLFKDLEYTAYGIFPSDYWFRGYGTNYDISIPEESSLIKQVVSAILMGEFRFDIGFTDHPMEKFVEAKLNIFESVSNDPIILYTHSNQPGHSQFQGACLSDEIERFSKRLMNVNFEMKQDIDTIAENDHGAIIIIAGDHGPYLTKNCSSTSGKYDISEITRMDIQDRFGSFLAIRWPTEDYVDYDDIVVLQDLFPAIFAYIYKDVSILESKIDPEIISIHSISGATVKNGIIYGGINDQESLFQSSK